MNEITSYVFDGSNVRTLVIDGQPYFVGKDVAEIIGYANTRDALSKHVDSEDKNTVAIHDGIKRGKKFIYDLLAEDGIRPVLEQMNLLEG